MDRDQTDILCAAVDQAIADRQPVAITGSGSKSFLLPDGSTHDFRMLSVGEHQGVLDYRPDELVVTARAGTTLQTLRQELARAGQMLPFEPPEFRDQGTLGGAIAAGLSGSARPWRGSVRDAVLGVRLINGYGETLRFGGNVVKNVAGYDVSRLQVGAFGTFGLLLEVSLRVVPIPAAEQTRRLELSALEALSRMRGWARRPLPVSGLCHFDDQLYVRLAGAESAILSAGTEIGGELLADSSIWSKVDTHQLALFQQPGALLCQRVPPACELPEGWAGLLEWGGARRWRRLSEDAEPLPDERPFDQRYARAQCCLPAGRQILGDYQARIRQAFDPHSIFNPELGNADIAA